MMLFEQLNREGTTILMVTHDALVASYSKELLYISDGEIKERLERAVSSKLIPKQDIIQMVKGHSYMTFLRWVKLPKFIKCDRMPKGYKKEGLA